MVKRKLFITLLCLSAMLFCCSLIGLIYAMVSVEVTNDFETGIVDITLKEYQKKGDTETEWAGAQTVLPGSVISLIPRIHNNGNDCYIRAKVSIRDMDDLDESNLLNVGDKWIKADDGYWYYTDALLSDEDVDMFDSLRIPGDFSQENQGEGFHVDIDVDAIQSQNFTPQFDLASPWGGVEILKAIGDGQYDINSVQVSDQTFSVIYQADSQKLIVNSDDFFANIPTILPGDTYGDTVQLVNDGNADATMYFRSEATDDSELPDKIRLKIVTNIDGNETTFYEGDLRAAELSKDTVLGVIPKGKEGTFYFEIAVPAELNNQYSLLASYVKWIFSTEPIIVPDEPVPDEPTPVEPTPEEPDKTDTPDINGANRDTTDNVQTTVPGKVDKPVSSTISTYVKEPIRIPPQTGVYASIGGWIVLMVISLAGVGTALHLYKKETCGE